MTAYVDPLTCEECGHFVSKHEPECSQWKEPTTPEQQDFCCAVVEDGGEHTIRWLHTTCHDYWGRIEKLEAEIESMREVVRQAEDIRATWDLPKEHPLTTALDAFDKAKS